MSDIPFYIRDGENAQNRPIDGSRRRVSILDGSQDHPHASSGQVNQGDWEGPWGARRAHFWRGDCHEETEKSHRGQEENEGSFVLQPRDEGTSRKKAGPMRQKDAEKSSTVGRRWSWEPQRHDGGGE